MSIRYVIAVALMASACGAQADVLPTTGATQSSFLSGWTTGKGTDVVASLNNASLIGGVSYGADSDSLIQALYEKASASVGAAGEVQLTYKQGVSGTYLTGISNARLAAMAGNGVSVINTADGVKIVAADGNLPASTGGGAAQGSGQGSGQGATNGVGLNGGQLPVDTPVSLPPQSSNGLDNTPGAGSGTGTGGDAGGTTGGTGEGAGAGGDGTGGNAGSGNATGTVPEPSSIALMLAGMFGAVGLRRRRAR